MLALAAPASAALGISTFSVAASNKQAAGHPDLTIHLPPGLVGNPSAAAKCSQTDFANDQCDSLDPGSNVGTVSVNAIAAGLIPLTATGDVYNVTPSAGEPARLGVWVRPLGGLLGKIGLTVLVSVRPSDFGLDTTINNIPTSVSGISAEIDSMTLTLNGTTSAGHFVTLPSSCTPATTRIDVSSYGSNSASATSTFTPTGCGSVPFHPTMDVSLETTRADTPSGYTVKLNIPTDNSTVSRTQVVLPVGTVLPAPTVVPLPQIRPT